MMKFGEKSDLFYKYLYIIVLFKISVNYGGNSMMWKGLVCGIIVLFLGMSIVPSVGSNSTKLEQSVINNNLSGIEIYGTMGNNFWYISSVTIILDFGFHLTYFKIDNGEWEIYYYPIIVTSDGPHTIYCYYIDPWGNPSEIYSASFKIDKTHPWAELEIHRLGPFKIGVTIYAYDNLSGFNGIAEIYLDDELLGTIDEPPYDVIIKTGLGEHTVSVIVYDCAGNSGESSTNVQYIQSKNQSIKSLIINHQILNVVKALLQ